MTYVLNEHVHNVQTPEKGRKVIPCRKIQCPKAITYFLFSTPYLKTPHKYLRLYYLRHTSDASWTQQLPLKIRSGTLQETLSKKD